MTTWNAEQPPKLPKLTWYQKIRGVVRIVTLVSVTLIALGLFLIGRSLRYFLGRWVVFHFWIAKQWSRICLALAGLTLTVSGKPIDRGALVANHSTWIDILALRAVHLIYFVSKDDVAAWPGIGFIARVTGTVFIKRKRTEAKRQEAILRERIDHDQLLCFFPEGTSTDGQRVLAFKSSLFSVFFHEGTGMEISIQPVALRYRPNPASKLPGALYGWWGDMPFEGHIWDIMTRSRGGQVDVTFLEPIKAAAFDNRKALADHCQSAVATGFARLGPANTQPAAPDLTGS